MRFFPYAPRASQRELTDLLSQAVRSEAHVVVEAGPGFGKTVCALASSLQAAQASGSRVVYLTRTHSQQQHILREFRRVREAAGLPLVGVALQGRKHLCPRIADEPELGEADAEEFGRMCLDRRQAAERSVLGLAPVAGPAPCPFFEAGLRRGTLEQEQWAQQSVPTAEELAARCAADGVCPDHVTRLLLPDAALVVCPYPYMLHPGLRQALLRAMRAELRECVIIVDEAHNIPDAARDLWTRNLAAEHCDAALAEAERYGDPSCHGLRATQFARGLRRAVLSLAADYLLEDDGPVPEGELEARLLAEFGCASPRLAQAVRGFRQHGDAIRERRRSEGKLPRSWLGACADFLAHWEQAGEESWAKLVEGPDPRLSCALLDAGLATKPLLEARATLHISGTLAPLEAYRDAVGLPANTPLHRLGGAPAPGQRLALLAPDLTTRHEDLAAHPELLARMAARSAELLALGRPALLCFPSHELLDRMLPLLPRDLGVERAGLGQAELMALVDDFRARRVRALAGVMGGRLTEGLDFPGEELEMVIVVGLPYPKPSFRLRALIEHLELRHGRGWEYAVDAPTSRRVAQAAGRLIRGPADRGVVILLDRRATRLLPLLPDLRPSDSLAAEAAAFLRGPPSSGR